LARRNSDGKLTLAFWTFTLLDSDIFSIINLEIFKKHADLIFLF
jgi:hypothetical protein